MKKDYKYLLSSGVNASHLFDVQHFERLKDAQNAASLLPELRAWKIERADLKKGNNLLIDSLEEIDNSKFYDERKHEAKRKAYCEKHGYKYESKYTGPKFQDF